MRAGNLDRTIRLDHYDVEAVDNYGTAAPDWLPIATVRAQIVQSSTDEFIRNGAVDETVIVFRTRYLAGVTTADRIHYDGKYFNIKETKEIGRRKGLELRAISTGET